MTQPNNLESEFYIYYSGGQHGPFAFVQLREMWEAAAIPSESLCWSEGWVDWRPLLDVMIESKINEVIKNVREEEKNARKRITEELERMILDREKL